MEEAKEGIIGRESVRASERKEVGSTRAREPQGDRTSYRDTERCYRTENIERATERQRDRAIQSDPESLTAAPGTVEWHPSRQHKGGAGRADYQASSRELGELQRTP